MSIANKGLGCGVWILCLMALFAVVGYGYVNGNPRRLHHGIDHLGRVCGVDAGVSVAKIIRRIIGFLNNFMEI